MYSDLSFLAPILAVCLVALFFANFGDSRRTRDRAAYGAFVAAVSLVYLGWRVFVSLDWSGTQPGLWPFVVVAIETLGVFSSLLFITLMSRAPRPVVRLPLPDGFRPSVDLFIPTYNESEDVIDKAIITALGQSYSNVRVHVLDDGRREWLRALCAKLGANYLTRADNRHAKAGNMNAALAQTDGDFIAIMDADFAASRDFVEALLPYFENPSVGVVQAPQCFYNADVIQSGLGISRNWVDEQRLFFAEIMPARDRWGAAFSCGACSITRRAALDAIGGFPTDSITEDMLTSLRLRRAGYKTVYHNEELARGLSADTAESYFTQRERWARGNIQILFLRDDFWFNRGLSWFQKLLFAPIYWVTMPLVAAMIALTPVVYLLFGVAPVHRADLVDALAFGVPFILAQQCYMLWISDRTFVPVLSTAVDLFMASRMLPNVFAAALRPFGAVFRVTPKNRGVPSRVDVYSASVIGLVWLATLLGVLLNFFPALEVISNPEFFPVAMGWALVTLVELAIAFLIAAPQQQLRATDRFSIGRSLDLRMPDGRVVEVLVSDMSMSGAGVDNGHLPLLVGQIVSLRLPGEAPQGDVWAQGKVVRTRGRIGVLWGDHDLAVRRRMVEFLFSGAFRSVPQRASRGAFGSVLKSLWT